MVLLIFFSHGEYGFTHGEFMLFYGMGIKFMDKVMLHCSGEVKCKQAFTTGI